ncbi:MAG TPA: ribose-phosphate pyrophosphokinase [Rhodothermales bacterium]|nr:ribose-phosphate pyrophosphokinase [Rhodothermales bacterium]
MLHHYDFRPISIFAGRSNPVLAEAIAGHYGQRLGNVTIKEFSDGELYVRFEESIRGRDVYLIQSTNPPASNWLELLLMIDAARRASADRITAVIPYFGYARQERKDQPRVSIAAKLMANMLTTAGADRILTMDLHAPQIQGFFDIPVDHLYGSAVFVDAIRHMHIDNLLIVAPDMGSIKRARAYASKLGCGLAVIDKRRAQANQSEVMNIIGDVKGKNVILVDDMADTAGTLVNAAVALHERGALEVRAACTHGIFSGQALERIAHSDIVEFLVTDTIYHDPKLLHEKITTISVAPGFADAIRRIYTDDSISTLFTE